jgi:hypothetical protein
MALQKISLRLGTKVISLTAKEFEELKRDMRELDKDHHYYWHHAPWYGPWYSGVRSFTAPIVYGSSSGSLSCNTAGFTPNAQLQNLVAANDLTIPMDAKPPEFSGSILSVL